MLHIWCYIHWFPDDNYFEIWPDHFEWSKSKSLILIGFQSAYGNGLCWISNNIVFLCSDYKKWNISDTYVGGRVQYEQNLIMHTVQVKTFLFLMKILRKKGTLTEFYIISLFCVFIWKLMHTTLKINIVKITHTVTLVIKTVKLTLTKAIDLTLVWSCWKKKQPTPIKICIKCA